MRQALLWATWFVLSGCCSDGHHAKEPVVTEKPVTDCESAQEFKTTMTYLRAAKEMKLAEPVMRTVALGVASGCTGAAGRFIAVTELLKKSGLDSASAIEIGGQAAQRSDGAAEAFSSIFKQAFLKSNLDLDIADALRLARKLSLDYTGSPATAQDDFAGIVHFCQEPRHLNLPKPACAKLAARIAAYGEGAEHSANAEAFITAFDFLTEDDGPHLTTADAIIIAEALVAVSPFAVDNFQQAFAYAVAPSGLKMERGEAVLFSQQVAKHSTGTLKVER